MSQHDLNIANQNRTNFRQDLNNALEAIASKQSGSGDPAITYPFQEKIVTSGNPAVVYIRNAANTAWVRIGYINASTGQLILDNAVDADTLDNKHYSDFSDKLVHDVTLAGTDTYTGTLPSGVSNYQDKMKVVFYVPNANTDTDPTINLSSKGARKILDRNGIALTPGEFAAGKVFCEYNSSADSGTGAFLLLNPKDAAVPAGTMLTFPTETPPPGWLERDGASLDRTTYSAIYAVIGTKYGAVDANHFNLPDHRGRFPRYWAHGSANDPDRDVRTKVGAPGSTMILGDYVGTEQADQLRSHLHASSASAVANHSRPVAQEGLWEAAVVGSTTASFGGNETRPINDYEMPIIKY